MFATQGDQASFDVFLEHTLPTGGNGFIGIEVKYHENLKLKPAGHKARYDEVTSAMGCFRPESLAMLRESPLERLGRDHMLAGAMLAAERCTSGLHVFLDPQRHTPPSRRIMAASAMRRRSMRSPSSDSSSVSRRIRARYGFRA
jgi:hypothetical protein